MKWSVRAGVNVYITKLLESCPYHQANLCGQLFQPVSGHTVPPVLMFHPVISLLLKKSALDKYIIKNYRPVSNLSFLSKVLEKVVATCLNSHINNSNTSNHVQSAYRKFHSTETALFKGNIKAMKCQAVFTSVPTHNFDRPKCSSFINTINRITGNLYTWLPLSQDATILHYCFYTFAWKLWAPSRLVLHTV